MQSEDNGLNIPEVYYGQGGEVRVINDKMVYRGADNRITTLGTIRNVKGEKRIYKSPFAKVFIKENTDELVENWAKENGYSVWKEDFGDSYEGGGEITHNEWKSILSKFLNEFYGDYEEDTWEDYIDSNSITSNQTKYKSGGYDWSGRPSAYDREVSFEEAYNTFYSALSPKERNGIKVSFDGGEYADAEAHDTDKNWQEITITKVGSSYEGGGSPENENEVYIEFLNKEKNFTKDRKSFKTYEDAVKWARENFEKFNPDMIHYYSGGGGIGNPIVLENPYNQKGDYLEDIAKVNITEIMKNVSFRKFGNEFRKHIDPYFSQEFNIERVNTGISWSELASYIIGEGEYYVEKEQYENFIKSFNVSYQDKYSDGGSTKPNVTDKIKHNDLMNRSDYTAYVKINDYPYTATVRNLNSFKEHLNRKDETFTPNVFGEITYISDNASDEWVYELNKLIDNKKKEMENKMENGGQLDSVSDMLPHSEPMGVIQPMNIMETVQPMYAGGGGVTKIPIAIKRKIDEINELLPKVQESGDIAGGYFGSTHYSYLELLKPIEIKNQFVYITANNSRNYYQFEKRYNVNLKDNDINGLPALKYDLSNILKSFKKLLQDNYSGGGGVGEQKQLSRTILNDTVIKLIKKNGTDIMKYSEYELSTLDSYATQRDISDTMAQTIWGMAIENGFKGYMSKVLVVNSGTGKILNYVNNDFSKVDAVNPSNDENTIATLLNNREVIDIHSDSLKLLSHYDLGIIINKNNADTSNLKMVCSKLKSNNMLIFVAPTSILYGDNAVKNYINEKFDLIKSVCDESSNSCISVLKKL